MAANCHAFRALDRGGRARAYVLRLKRWCSAGFGGLLDVQAATQKGDRSPHSLEQTDELGLLGLAAIADKVAWIGSGGVVMFHGKLWDEEGEDAGIKAA